MGNNKYERIDFLSDWQKHFAFGLGDVTISEKTIEGETLSEIIMSTNQFDNMVDFYFDNFTKFDSESLIYKYFNRDYIGGEESWATDSEVKIERLDEFLNHLKNIDESFEPIQIVKNEYETLIAFISKVIKNNNHLFFMAESY